MRPSGFHAAANHVVHSCLISLRAPAHRARRPGCGPGIRKASLGRPGRKSTADIDTLVSALAINSRNTSAPILCFAREFFEARKSSTMKGVDNAKSGMSVTLAHPQPQPPIFKADQAIRRNRAGPAHRPFPSTPSNALAAGVGAHRIEPGKIEIGRNSAFKRLNSPEERPMLTTEPPSRTCCRSRRTWTVDGTRSARRFTSRRHQRHGLTPSTPEMVSL